MDLHLKKFGMWLEVIKSRQNKQIKLLFKLLKKKYQDIENKFLIFGMHAIEEAIKADQKLDVYTSNKRNKGTLISDVLMKELSPTETPYDVVAIVEKPTIKPYANKVLILDSVQDPGNVGSLIRSAVAFGFNTIIRNESSASFYNEKTVRATQGNLFYANLVTANISEEIEKLKQDGYVVVATTLDGNTNFNTLKNTNKIAVILGNEGQGISNEILKLADHNLTLSTLKVESLNVMAAGSIIMYELGDQND